MGVSAKRIHFAPSYETWHKDKYGVIEAKLREDKLKNLKSNLQWQQNRFTVATKSHEVAVVASLAISQSTAKKSKPFMDGEYVKESIMRAGEVFCPKTSAF